MNEQIARRYAQALFETGQETGQLDIIREDMGKIRELMKESEEFGEFLFNPVAPKNKQRAVLEKIFEKSIHAATLTFLFFLTEKGRLNLLGKVCETFEEYCLDFKNIMKVKIVSGAPLNNRQESSLKSHLKAKLDKQIQAEVQVDTGMLGGIKVCIGDEIHDYTLRTQLENFRQNFLKTG